MFTASAGGAPRRAWQTARSWLIGAALALLAGCSTVSSVFSSSSTAPAAACPTATILRPLRQTAVFAPGTSERRPVDVAFYGVLDDVSVTCERSGDSVEAKLNVVIIGQRGLSARGAPGVDLQYFVAVTGPGDTILSKRSLPVHIAIPTDKKRAGVTDHIVETIPLGGRPPSQLSIVLGFQQSPAVVDFYHHYRGR